MSYFAFTCLLLVIIYFIYIFLSENLNGEDKINIYIFSKDQMIALKGFSIIIITIGHLGNLFGIRYLNPLGSLGVAVFLFCSGYGLQKSNEKNKLIGFWRKRIVTSYIPYVLMELFGYIFLYNSLSTRDILFDMLLISPLHPFGWYMQCLFLYYIVFYISVVFERINVGLKYLILLISSVCIFIFLRSLFKQQVLSFILGVVISQYYDRIKEYVSNYVLGISFLIFGLGMLAIKQTSLVRNSGDLLFYLIELLQTTLFMLFLLILGNVLTTHTKSKFVRPFYNVGIISYEIYLIHAFLMPININCISIATFYLMTFIISFIVHFVRKYLMKKIGEIYGYCKKV